MHKIGRLIGLWFLIKIIRELLQFLKQLFSIQPDWIMQNGINLLIHEIGYYSLFGLFVYVGFAMYKYGMRHYGRTKEDVRLDTSNVLQYVGIGALIGLNSAFLINVGVVIQQRLGLMVPLMNPWLSAGQQLLLYVGVCALLIGEYIIYKYGISRYQAKL